MDTATIDALADAAFSEAAKNPQRVPRYFVADNATLQTDIYDAPEGRGFRVVCRIVDDATGASVARVLSHGPDSGSTCNWPDDIAGQLRRLAALYGLHRH